MIDLEKIEKERDALKAKLDKLNAELDAGRTDKLKSIPQQFGLDSVDALIATLIPHASRKLRTRIEAALEDKADVHTPAQQRRGKRKRGKVDDAKRDKIKAALEAKDRTAVQIAKEFDVSTATVNLIKKAAGLTKKRK